MFSSCPRWLSSLFVICACLASFGSQRARASTFDVSPIKLTLGSKLASAMLTVTNRGTEPLRFQVSASAWAQKPDGEMVMTPTKDIVFFPALITLNPGEARKLRVGMNVKPEAVEKSYRVFVQELPALVKKPEDQGAVRVLTKMGIPVFIAPETPNLSAQLGGLAFSGGGKLTFSVKNAGNVHFRPEALVITAKDDAKVVHSEEIIGWYVLAGAHRDYVVELPKDACLTLKSLQVELRMDKGGTKAALASARCVP